MNEVVTWQSALISSWDQVWTSILRIIPLVLGAIVVFSIGLILSYWVKRMVIQILGIVGLRKLSESLGIDSFLKKADIKLNLAELIGVVAEWILILVFFLAAVDILGLKGVSVVLTRVLSYIPNIIAAALIFGAGYFIAGFVEKIVRAALASVDHEAAKPLSKLTRWIVLVVAFFAGVDQLQIARTLIATFFQGLTYTIVLAVGISVGLGAKDVVARLLNDWYEKIRK